MKDPDHNTELIAVMRKALRQDHIHTEAVDLTPLGIISHLHLLDVNYEDVAFGGHFGKDWLPWEMDDEFIEDAFGD